jgi:hypothetical protein
MLGCTPRLTRAGNITRLPNSGKPSGGGVISLIGTLTRRKVRLTKVTVKIGTIRQGSVGLKRVATAACLNLTRCLKISPQNQNQKKTVGTCMDTSKIESWDFEARRRVGRAFWITPLRTHPTRARRVDWVAHTGASEK